MNLIMKYLSSKSWLKEKIEKPESNFNHVLKNFLKAWVISICVMIAIVPIALSVGHKVAADISAAKELAEGALK